MASNTTPRAKDTLSSPLASSSLSQYPFPLIETPPRQQIAQRGNFRRGSTASSIASFGSSFDAGSINRSTVVETGQNAISTLLQHPIVRTGLQPFNAVPPSGYKAPTQRDIPPVTLTNIPHIESKSFHSYLSQVGSLYEAFQRAKNEGEGDTSLFHREKRENRTEEWEAVLTKRLQRPGYSRTSSVSSPVTSPSEIVPSRRKSNVQKRHAVTPLSTIPSVYSDADFHLENPRTFDIISEGSEIVRDPKSAPSGKRSLATNAILQEKLSWYMDTVEIHLISSISTASKSFFSALGSLRELHAEASDSIGKIQKLRKDLARLDREMAVDGLKVINLKQRRDNVRKLAETMMQLEAVVNAVRKCEDMVENGKIDGALNDLDVVESLIAGRIHSPNESVHKYTIRDLRGTKALVGAVEDLNQLRSRVGRGFEGRFHNSLLNDIRQHVKTTETAATLQRWENNFTRPKAGQRRSPSMFPGYMNITAEFRTELEAEMKGLSRAKNTTPAATAFRTLVLREMKNMIRRQLPSSTDDDNVSVISASTQGGRHVSQQEKSSTLARNLRALDAEDWFKMLSTVYTNISEGLRRLSVQVKILLDITSNLSDDSIKSPKIRESPSIGNALSPRMTQGRPRSESSVQAEMQQALDLSSLLGEGVDLVQAQTIKVVKVRSQQNSELPLIDFLRYFALNRLFIDECEAISGRSGAALKNVLDTQIKEFVAKFGDTQKTNIIKVMDMDKWDAKDFGDDQNIVLARVTGGSTADSQYWLQGTTLSQNLGTTPKIGDAVSTNGISAIAKDKVRSAVIDEQKYILPESAISMLRSVDAFQHLATGIPAMSQEVISLLLESFKIFNSRSSQLILGAGATRSAGLKNITTKHLALSSQALSFIAALIPHVREFFRRHLSNSASTQVMTEFDKVRRLFQEHQNGIHEKLVDIMSGRASVHVKAMKKIDWEEAAKDKSQPVSVYMETLVKETATLQKVLAKHLSEPVVASIMTPVFMSYKSQWQSAFTDVSVHSIAAKERLLADVEFFNQRISKLEGAAEVGEILLQTINAKEVIVTPDKTSTEQPQAVPSEQSIEKAEEK